MYKAPIEIITTQLRTKIKHQAERLVCEAVQNVGVDVDKEELIKALKHDRGQYKKGYDDGFADGIRAFAEKLKEYFPSIAEAVDYTAQEVLKS